MSLRKRLIRLAHQNPTLRPHLISILKQGSAWSDAQGAPKTLKQVGKYFERKYGLTYRFDPKGNTWGDGPEVSIWDEGDEPHYAATLNVSWEDGGYSVDIYQRPKSVGTSIGPASVREVIREAERLAKKESDLI